MQKLQIKSYSSANSYAFWKIPYLKVDTPQSHTARLYPTWTLVMMDYNVIFKIGFDILVQFTLLRMYVSIKTYYISDTVLLHHTARDIAWDSSENFRSLSQDHYKTLVLSVIHKKQPFLICSLGKAVLSQPHSTERVFILRGLLHR